MTSKLAKLSRDEKTYDIYVEDLNTSYVNIQYVPVDLPQFEELCIETLRKEPKALQYIPEKRRTLQMCMIAIDYDSSLYQFVPDHVWEQFTKTTSNDQNTNLNDGWEPVPDYILHETFD